MFNAFFFPFIAILFAEFLDKSQISVLLLATKTKRHFLLLLGVMLGFILVDGTAILFGSFLTTLIPELWLKYIAAAMFIVFGILSLRSSHDEDNDKPKKITNPLLSGFLVVLLSEWGDKTQLASAVFASQYNPLLVLAGVMLALLILSSMAILLSTQLIKHLGATVVQKIAGIIFILLGIFFLL